MKKNILLLKGQKKQKKKNYLNFYNIYSELKQKYRLLEIPYCLKLKTLFQNSNRYKKKNSLK